MNNDVTLGPIPYNFHQLVLISIVKYSDIFANYVETQDLDFDNHLECILNEQIICRVLYLYLFTFPCCWWQAEKTITSQKLTAGPFQRVIIDVFKMKINVIN